MLNLFISALQIIACLYVLVRGIGALNHMSASTSHAIRYAYVMMTAGSAYGVLSAQQPNLSGALIAAGVALFLFGDRRNAVRYAVH